jgi:D-amino-acid dehydrogenase
MARPDSPFYVRPSPAVIPRTGLLNVFNDERAFSDACREARADELDGIAHRVLTAGELRAAGPPLAGPVAGAIFYPDEAFCDPKRFVSAVAAEADELGVERRTGVEVLELRRSGSRIDSLWTTAGDIAVGELVVAAGVWSRRFGSMLGVELPIEAGKGYHVDVPAAGGDPGLPIWLHEDRVVITPLGDRIRFAGTLELSGLDRGVSRRRVDAIGAAVARHFPELAARPAVDVWRGMRPCTPDGLPIIGRSAVVENATLATGHGMWGLQLAPVTAQLAAPLISGEAPTHDLGPLRPDRFGPRLRASAEPEPIGAGAP